MPVWVTKVSSLAPDGVKTSKLDGVGKHLFGDKIYRSIRTRHHAQKLEKGQYLIFNLDTSDKPGSHWVALTTISCMILLAET